MYVLQERHDLDGDVVAEDDHHQRRDQLRDEKSPPHSASTLHHPDFLHLKFIVRSDMDSAYASTTFWIPYSRRSPDDSVKVCARTA